MEESKPTTDRTQVALSQVFVQRQFRSSEKIRTEDSGEVLAVHKFVTEPAKVGLEYGITKNLGNHEFAKVAVLVQVPCYREEMDHAYAQAREWAEARIKMEMDEFKNRSPF